MAYNSIPDAWREVGKAVKKDLVDLVHDNLEDLNGRVTNVEGAVSTALITNTSVKKERDHHPLGTILWSQLSNAEFQAALQDGTWVLCDGSSTAGSDYATLTGNSTVPDIRGRFLRMKDHGAGRNADGDTALGTAQADSIKAHLHTIDHGHSHTIAASGTFASTTHRHNIAHVHQWASQDAKPGGTMRTYTSSSSSFTDWTHSSPGSSATFMSHQAISAGAGAGVNFGTYDFTISGADEFYTSGVVAGPSGGGGSAESGLPTSTGSVSNSGSVTSMTGNSGSTGIAETRPQNVTENAFIKVNKNYITTRTGYFLWRAPQSLTVNQVVVTPVTQGTSGTLTVDVLKGPLGSIVTSIFNVVPDLAYNDTTAQTGTLNPTNSQVAAGEYIRVDVTTTQAKLQEFHLLIAATPS